MEAVGLISGRVELRVEKTRRQHRVDRAITSVASVTVRILILIDAEVLIAVDAADIRRVRRQQIVLHWRLGLRRVAQTSRPVLTRVQVVVVVALVLIVSRHDEIIRGAAVGREGTRVVCVATANRAGVHQRLVRHLG